MRVIFLSSCLLLTIWMPRTGYHKLYSCTFLSGTVKCRVIYSLYRLYALEDPLTKYTLSITQPKSNFLGSCSRHVLKEECKAWFDFGVRILDQTWNGIGKITYLDQTLARQESYCMQGQPELIFGGVVKLYWNWMWCFVELKYNVCSQL